LNSIEMKALEREYTMPNTQGEVLLAPSTRNSMQITRTNTTSLDLDIDIVVTKRLRLELVQLEISPVLRVLDLEALERIWVNHLEMSQLTQEAFQSDNCLREKSIEKKREREEENQRTSGENKPNASTRSSTIGSCSAQSIDPAAWQLANKIANPTFPSPTRHRLVAGSSLHFTRVYIIRLERRRERELCGVVPMLGTTEAGFPTIQRASWRAKMVVTKPTPKFSISLAKL
jgi:hypothetical protein